MNKKTDEQLAAEAQAKASQVPERELKRRENEQAAVENARKVMQWANQFPQTK